MAELLSLLTGVSFIIILGFISDVLFDKTHIPDVMILFLFGILIGPVLGYVSTDQFAQLEPVFITLALILILFEGAFNIKLTDFIKEAYSGTALSIVFFIFSVVTIFLLMIFFQYPAEVAILLGTILGGTSSAVVIPMLKLIKIDSKASLVMTLESTISDVLCIVASLTILEVLKINSLDVTRMISTLLSTFLIAVFLGVMAGIFWFFIKNTFHQFDRAYMITLAFVILLYVAIESLNANGAIGVLAFGIVLGNSKKIFQNVLKGEVEYKVNSGERTFYSEISFFVKVFFFVYLGLIIDFKRPYLFLYGLVISLFLVMIRPYVIRIITRNAKEIKYKDKVMMGIMIPKGIAAAVLARITLASPEVVKLKGAEDISIIALSVILFSIVITSILVFLFEKILKPSEPESIAKEEGKKKTKIKKSAEKADIKELKDVVEEYLDE